MAYPRIKELREQHDFTQQNVADKLNLPLATYRSYETGAREPGIETLMLLSELYGVTVDYLLDHKPKPALISSDEFKKVKKYRELDEYGKKAVNLLLDVEHERCTKQKMIKSFQAARSVDNHEPETDISEQKFVWRIYVYDKGGPGGGNDVRIVLAPTEQARAELDSMASDYVAITDLLSNARGNALPLPSKFDNITILVNGIVMLSTSTK